jgi:hypothetical protein
VIGPCAPIISIGGDEHPGVVDDAHAERG